MNKKRFDISAATMHILAMAFMLCDHLWATLLPAQEWMTCVGRIAFPIFAFMAVEGCFHGYDPFQFPEFYESISRQDLLDFIRKNICEDRAALSAIYPKEEPSPCAL